jgi:hypothetical protein
MDSLRGAKGMFLLECQMSMYRCKDGQLVTTDQFTDPRALLKSNQAFALK